MDNTTNTITAAQQRLANQIARKAGYGKATKVVIGATNRVLSHRPWGFATNSGKFFAGVRTTKYGWNGTYVHAETVVEIAG